MMKLNKLVILLMSLSLLIFSCESDDQDDMDACNPADMAGEVLDTKTFSTYQPEQVQFYLDLFGAPPGLAPQYAVEAIKVVYNSRDKEGELVKASGVLFIPTGMDTLTLMSIQHGTEFKRDQVGSVNPLYAFDGMMIAMAGYMVFEADYLGLGESDGIHPYLHAELSANAVIDGIRAARIYACQQGLILDDNLFLAGYSEGGFATMAAHKYIEEQHSDEFQLTAVAPMAGPYDLITTTESILNRREYGNPGYIAYVATAYNDVYEWDRLDEIFQEPYASIIPGLLNGDYNGETINDTLTTVMNELFLPAFRSSFLLGGESDFRSTLEVNSLLNWGPIAPVRLYHGTNDSTVYYENSVTAFDSLRSNGAVDITLVPLIGANHGTGAFPAYYEALRWFDQVKAGR